MGSTNYDLGRDRRELTPSSAKNAIRLQKPIVLPSSSSVCLSIHIGNSCFLWNPNSKDTKIRALFFPILWGNSYFLDSQKLFIICPNFPSVYLSIHCLIHQEINLWFHLTDLGLLPKMASASSQPQFRYTQPPSKVLHLRNLPWECTEEELIELGKPFGKVVNTKCNVGANRNQAFIEFVSRLVFFPYLFLFCFVFIEDDWLLFSNHISIFFRQI